MSADSCKHQQMHRQKAQILLIFSQITGAAEREDESCSSTSRLMLAEAACTYSQLVVPTPSQVASTGHIKLSEYLEPTAAAIWP